MMKVGDIFKHYKGTLYQIVGFAIHTETLEPLVIYREYGTTEGVLNAPTWARPQSMFSDVIDETNGTLRFTYIQTVERH